MKTINGRLCILAGLFGVSAAFAAGGDLKAEYDKRNAERYVATFRTLDRNADGAVSREESRGTVDFTAQFDDIDINRDGQISALEMARYIEQQHGLRVEL